MRRPIHPYQRDAKYNQRRMAATEVGFGATFSAATLNDENISNNAQLHPAANYRWRRRDEASLKRRTQKNDLANEPSLLHNFAALLFLVE
jgi:hypothetical protein